MTATYNYLNQQGMDGRILLIAGYLARHCRDKHIVDLNCGHAPILHYIPKTYGTYRANDLDHDCFKHNHWRITFYHLTDEKFTDALHNTEAPVDILLGLGLNDGRVSGEPLESKTLLTSLERIANHHRPEIIILETPVKYEEAFHPIQNLTQSLNDYNIVMDWCVDSYNKFIHPLQRRRVVILK
jgi:hypothetical protein